MHSNGYWRRSSVAVTIQIVSIIFSILLALGLNDWKESRSNKRLALTTLNNFREELGNNKRVIEAALRDQRVYLRSLENNGSQVSTGDRNTSAVPGINLPEVLTAAWETALISKTMGYIDYDVILKLSELYLQQRWLQSLEEKVFQTILSPNTYDGENSGNLARSLHASLKNIMDVEGKLLAMYDVTLKKIETQTEQQ